MTITYRPLRNPRTFSELMPTEPYIIKSVNEFSVLLVEQANATAKLSLYHAGNSRIFHADGLAVRNHLLACQLLSIQFVIRRQAIALILFLHSTPIAIFLILSTVHLLGDLHKGFRDTDIVFSSFFCHGADLQSQIFRAGLRLGSGVFGYIGLPTKNAHSSPFWSRMSIKLAA